MGYKLCTTEKPSVAKDIARVIGATERKNGYFIGNGYIVTWAVGHLIGLAEPEEYGYVNKSDMWNDEMSKQIAYDELPLFPREFKTTILESTKEQFQIVRDLMHRNDVDYIIDCGDMGAEGHILQWLIREKAGNTKPVKRFCATSMTDEAIKKSMANLRNIDDFNNIIVGEFCKKRADWILGMSMSRCASIKYNAKVDVGRVQSPTLYFIVKRYIDFNNFKSQNYYQLKIALNEGFNIFWLKDNMNIIDLKYKDSKNRLLKKEIAEKMVAELSKNKTGTITILDLNHKATDRPQLYDITELQRDGNKIYGYTANEVLEIAQSLYEKHKVLSYPRTDSRYITTDLISYMGSRIEEISTINSYKSMADRVLNSGLNIDNKIVDDAKVTDHHALIVTEKISHFDFSTLSKKEKEILHLIITRMLVAFSYKYTYDETVVNVTFPNGIILGAKGNKPISLGWQFINNTLMGKEMKLDSNEQLFPHIKKGQLVSIEKLDIIPKKTLPLKLHTEASLLTAMENAGSSIENGYILKGRGIGTQATRGSIIKSLFDKKYVTNKQVGKTNYLIPTKQGINTIKVLPSDLYSPKITADWEEYISKIIKCELSEEDFMNTFEVFINKKIKDIKTNTVSDIDFTYEHEVFSICPWCGKDVYAGQIKNKSEKQIDSYYCSGKCGFSLQKDNIVFVARTKRNLTTSQIKNLIEKGSITSSCLSKNEVKYKGLFKLQKSPRGFATLIFEFVNEKKK